MQALLNGRQSNWLVFACLILCSCSQEADDSRTQEVATAPGGAPDPLASATPDTPTPDSPSDDPVGNINDELDSFDAVDAVAFLKDLPPSGTRVRIRGSIAELNLNVLRTSFIDDRKSLAPRLKLKGSAYGDAFITGKLPIEIKCSLRPAGEPLTLAPEQTVVIEGTWTDSKFNKGLEDCSVLAAGPVPDGLAAVTSLTLDELVKATELSARLTNKLDGLEEIGVINFDNHLSVDVDFTKSNRETSTKLLVENFADYPLPIELSIGDDFDSQTIEAIAQLRSVTKLTLANNAGFADVDLSALAQLPHLRELLLWHCSTFTNDHLKGIGSIRSLRRLDIMWGKPELKIAHYDISAPGLVELARIPWFRVLRLYPWTDEGIEPLKFRAEEYAAIAQLPKLTHLELLHCASIPDDSMSALSESESLVAVDLSFSEISAGGLSTLAKIPNLIALDLGGGQVHISDASVFNAFPKLEKLDLSDVEIPDAVIEELKSSIELKR